MVRLRAQIIKELLSYLRDPKSRMTLIIPPLMQLLIFSFAATLEVKNVDIVVLDRDSGRWSHEIVQRIEASSFVSTVSYVNNPDELQTAIDTRRALIGIRFLPDFSRNIESNRPASIQLLLDGRRANSAQIAQSYISTMLTDLNEELHPSYASRMVTTITRNWFNPNLIYQWFIVPALVGTLAMTSSLIVCALSIARERELGTFDQLLVSPAHPLEIIVGKMIPALMVGSSLACVMIGAAVFLFGVPFTGSLPLLLLSLILFIASVVGIGLMISSICSTQQQAILGTFSVIVPLILLSGFATPVDNMPTILQYIAQADPLKHFLAIVHASFLKDVPAHLLLANIWPMLIIFLVTFTLAVIFIRGKLQ